MRIASIVSLLALLAGCASDGYDRISLNSVSTAKLSRVHTYYVRTGDRHAMACLTDPEFAKGRKDCARAEMRHHPQARDVVQSVMLAKGCDIMFVWEEPTSYAPGERVGGMAAQPDGIPRFTRPLAANEAFLELQTASSSAGMFDEKSGKRTPAAPAKAPFANATAQVFAPGLIQAVYNRAASTTESGNLKGIVEDVLEPLPDCARY
jgi:hypothetical protein